MTQFVALLRAVNVGGTNILSMDRLKKICQMLGFSQIRTYIQSGNVVFQTDLNAASAKHLLEARLLEHAGISTTAIILTAHQLQGIMDANPFHDADPKKTSVFFLGHDVPSDAIATASGQTDEDIATGVSEIFIHYPSGMGRSKLKFPGLAEGTARNFNTIRKLFELAKETSGS